MPTYKVKPGFTHGASNQYKAGDTVELTEQEAAGFLDKLELVTGKKAKAASESDATDLRAALQGASLAELADALGVDANALAVLREGKGATRQGGLVVNPTPADTLATKAEAVKDVEQRLEAETGRDFVQIGAQPPTFVETDAPKESDSPKRNVPRR